MSKHEKKIIVFTLAAVFVGILLFSSVALWYIAGLYNTKDWFPAEGCWYCSELGIQIDFESDQETFVVSKKTGDYIRCDYRTNPGVDYLWIVCRQEHEPWKLADCVFEGTYVDLSDKELTLCDQETKDEYVFRRVD